MDNKTATRVVSLASFLSLCWVLDVIDQLWVVSFASSVKGRSLTSKDL